MACFLCLCLFLFHLLFQPTACSSNFSSSSLSSSSQILLCPRDQTLALLQFKNSLSLHTSLDSCFSYGGSYFASRSRSPYPKTESWREDTDCCSWDGVTCDTKTGHVISLDLACSMLRGTISSNSTLFLLPHLQKLDLSHNNFSGSPVSVKFGQFLKLTHLNLNNSYFVGRVPSEISLLSRLVSLDLSWNYELMLEPITFNRIVQNLTKLQQLHLTLVNMSLVAPNSLGNLSSSLSSLALALSGLHGEFPVNILGQSNLQVLDLSSNGDLTGSFPKSNGSRALSYLDLSWTRISIHLEQDYFNNFESLKFLNLHSSNFIGSKLELFGNLTQLTELFLSYNRFGGEIPSSLGSLLHLNILYLSHNNFSGQIPTSLRNLTQLSFLSLYKNNIGGQIPSFFGNLKQLIALDLSYNSFTGPIPSSFGNLKHLNYLDLSYNNFTGPIPSQISNLSTLTSLYLSNNSLYGTIPSFLFSLPSLQTLSLDNNLLTGHINQFKYESSLEYIDFRNNMLSGPIPRSIFKAVNLSILMLSSNNKLTGEIPYSICNLKFLQILDLSNNSLSGFIPQCLGNFTDILSVLHLGANNFQGTIPTTFLEGNDLRYLNLNGNNLKGPIPPSIINCTNLEFLDLGKNKIEDAFPHFLETLPKLQVLVLHSNKLYGFMKSPISNSSFPMLQILDLSSNSLSGPLPTNFKAMMKHDQNMRMGYMLFSTISDYDYVVQITWKGVEILFGRIESSLTTIDLSSNNFTGKIPESIGKLISLQALNLSHNYLTGPIPPSLGNLTNLESLDFSANYLVGKIPRQLVAITFLQVLDLSNNRLEGPIPRGKQFNTFDSSSYAGNSGLCDFPLPNCNIDGRQPPSFLQEEEDSKVANGFGWKVVMIGYGFGLLFGFTMGCVMFKTRKPEWLVRIIEEELLQQAKFLKRILA